MLSRAGKDRFPDALILPVTAGAVWILALAASAYLGTRPWVEPSTVIGAIPWVGIAAWVIGYAAALHWVDLKRRGARHAHAAAVIFGAAVALTDRALVLAPAFFACAGIVASGSAREDTEGPLRGILPWLIAFFAGTAVVLSEPKSALGHPAIALATLALGGAALAGSARSRFRGLAIAAGAAGAAGAAALIVTQPPDRGPAMWAAAVIAFGLTQLAASQRAFGRTAFFHPVMVALALVTLMGADNALAPLPAREEPPKPAAPVEAHENAVPAGFFNQDPAPGGWWIQTGHFRMGAPGPKKPGTLRIVAQGSSTTEGLGVENDADVWTSVLQRDLADWPRPIEVVNAGIQGTTSFGMLLNFRRVVKNLSPDILILYAGANDGAYSHGPLTEREIYDLASRGVFEGAGDDESGAAETLPTHLPALPTRAAIERRLAKSTLYRVLADSVYQWRGAGPPALSELVPVVAAVPVDDFRDNLNAFADECRDAGIRLVLVSEVSRIDIEPYRAAMEDTAGRRGVPYLDGQAASTECDAPIEALISDTVHLTVEGNACVGRAVAKFLREHMPAALDKEAP